MQTHEKKEQMMRICILGLAIVAGFLVGCSLTIMMNHTEGEAQDLVDQIQTSKADITPNVSIIPK